MSGSPNQSSALILQPSQHLHCSDSGVAIELSNMNRFTVGKSSTLPRPLPPPRIPRSPDISTGCTMYQTFHTTGTLDRKEANAKEFADLKV